MTINLTIECSSHELALYLVRWTLTRDYTVVGIADSHDEPDPTPEDVDAIFDSMLTDSPEHRVLDAFEREIERMLAGEPLTPGMLHSMITDLRGTTRQLVGSNSALRRLDGIISRLEGELSQFTDQAPPHGIERPGYWLDKRLAKTQGSGKKHPGLEDVPCPTCSAPVGAVCVAESHAGYRRNFGHASRRNAHQAQVRGES